MSDLQYWAGLFDGEGCVTTTKQTSGSGYTLWAVIGMTCEQVLMQAQSRFGGKIQKRKKLPGRKQQWEWRLWCGQAENFLRAIEPYSIVKQDEIRTAIMMRELSDQVRPRGRYGKPEWFWQIMLMYRLQLSELKKR